jgi:hypothetical protein
MSDQGKTAARWTGHSVHMSHLDLHALQVWLGVRRAGLSMAEPTLTLDHRRRRRRLVNDLLFTI